MPQETVQRTPRTNDALSLGVLMTEISALNSFCYCEPARRVLDDTLRKLDKIRLEAENDAFFARRAAGRVDEADWEDFDDARVVH